MAITYKRKDDLESLFAGFASVPEADKKEKTQKPSRKETEKSEN